MAAASTRPDGDPADPLELRRFDPGDVSRAIAEVAEGPVCSLTARSVTRSNTAGCRNGRISARPSFPIAGAVASIARLVAHLQRHRHQDVRPVGHQRGASPRPWPAEVGQRRRAVGPDHHAHPVQLPVRDAELMEPPDRIPDATQERVVDLAGIERVERPAVDLAHQQGVALRPPSRRRRPASPARRRVRRGGSRTPRAPPVGAVRPTRAGASRPGARVRPTSTRAADLPRHRGRTPSPVGAGRPARSPSRARPRSARTGRSVGPAASTPISSSAAAIWSRVRRPPGDPTIRWTSAAAPTPTTKPATTPTA